MVFNGKVSTNMTSPERLSVTLVFERMTFKILKLLFWPHLISSDTLTSKYNQFIFFTNASNCNFGEIPTLVLRYCVHNLLVYDDGHMDSPITKCHPQLITSKCIKICTSCYTKSYLLLVPHPSCLQQSPRWSEAPAEASSNSSRRQHCQTLL